jgi:hypothetical protein
LFTSDEKGFISKINLTEIQKKNLRDARSKVRDKLRTGLSTIVRENYSINISPRFMSQGSYVYKTQNQPCFNPPQQIDHDLGCYLPLSYIETSRKPKIAADYFFKAVDQLLTDLVKEEGWKKVDISKNTCSRVVIDNEVHIDVPLYSIPDNEFTTINESALKNNQVLSEIRMDSLSFNQWAIIKDQVLLAHRKLGWKPSDPRKLNKYFTDNFKVKGEQLRRICRYLKAWRDYKWQDNGPSSICLMILVDSIYTYEKEKRDDIALLQVLRELPVKIQQEIKNPTDDNEEIELPMEIRAEMKAHIESFISDLNAAIYNEMDSKTACSLVRKHLGLRFPIENDLQFVSNYRTEVLTTPITKTENREPEKRGRAA